MSPDLTTPEPATAPATKKITRDDIESKLRELRGEVDEEVEAVKMPAIAIAVGVAVATVVGAYWFGRRRGRKRQTVLEIRRI
jgi:cobalamin biosynthesis Mg chelatase CobN